MANYERTAFTKTTVELDGNAYTNCVFTDSVLVYRGGVLPVLVGNAITDCTWRFDDAALRTLHLLHALFVGGAKDVVDDFIKAIKSGPQATPPSVH